MACPESDQIIDQTRAVTLDPWFTLHLLVCDECRLIFEMSCFVREVFAELTAESGEIWEPPGAQIEVQLLRMMAGWPSSSGTIQ